MKVSAKKPLLLFGRRREKKILSKMIDQRSPLSISTPKLDGFLSVSPFSFTKNVSFESLFSSEVSPCYLASVFESLSPSNLPTPTSILMETKSTKIIQIQPQRAPTLQLPPDFKKIKQEKIKKKNLIEKVKEEVIVENTINKQNQTTTRTTKQNEKETTSRSWNIVFMDEQLRVNDENISVEITSKTRCQEPNPEVPETLYSSLKYEITQKFNSKICKQEQFVLSRISLVDASNGVVLSKSMKGVTECSLTKTEQKTFYGVLKCQFADLAHYNKKSDLSWEINYYLPSDIQKSVLAIRSAPFKVFARKPKIKKRKASTFDEFLDRLDDLVKASKKLKEEDKKLALEMVSSKFNEIDDVDFMLNQEEEFEN